MVKSYAQNLLRAVALCLCFVTIFSPPFALSQRYNVSSRSLVLKAPSGETYKGKSVPSISSKKTLKNDGESLAAILRRNGIQFNGSAASIFYNLNPRVSNFENLPPGSEVNTPYATGDLEIQNALKSGFLVYISADSSLRTAIVANVETLLQIKPSVLRLDAGAFASSEQMNNFTAKFSQATDYLRDVKIQAQEDTQPFTTETLRQYRDDSEVLVTVATNISRNRRVSKSESDAISLVTKDLETKARGLNGSRSPGNAERDPQATMIVTLLPPNSSRATSLRLCYATEAMFTKRRQCSTTLGPHAKWTLPVADYLVWAGLDESSPPVMKPRPVPLEKVGEEIPVELRLPD
jgi:hypothetical protein